MLARHRLQAPIAALAVGLTTVGCGGSSVSTAPSSSSDPAEARPSTLFAAKTEGAPADLLAHLRVLEESYRTSAPADVDTSRANLMAYTRAVEATGKALMAKKDSPEEARMKGGIAVLDALRKRIELDPRAFDAFLATTDRMESENPDTKLATLGAFARYEQISEVPEDVAGTPAERLDRRVDALRRLAEVKPKFDKAPEFIRELIEVAKGLGRYDKVEALYLLHLKEFPDDPYSAYAKGGAYLASLHGKTVDDFKGTDAVTGKPIDLKAMRGKVVIVDFWATWCAPCMKEMPDLLEAHHRLGPLGFEIIGVNLDDTPQGLRAVASALGSTWPQLFEANPKGEPLSSPTVVKYGIIGIPLKLLFDRDGKLVATGHSLEEIFPKLFPLVTAPNPAKKAATEPEPAKPKEAK